jgi:putative chitinase
VFPRTPAQWAYLLGALGVKATTAAKFAEAFATYCTPDALNLGERELDDLLGQALMESGKLERLSEGLQYRAARIRELGAMMGAGSRWARAAASADALAARRDDGTPYPDAAEREQALAEVLYGGRFGNDNPGDGWRYRGRGLPQITFAANYARVGKALGLDLLADPDLLLRPDVAVRALLAWWEDTVTDDAVDHDDRVRKLVNGSTLGVAETAKLAAAARAALPQLA